MAARAGGNMKKGTLPIIIAMILAGCSSDSGGQADGSGIPDLCKEAGFDDPNCGQPCTLSEDCGPNLYCGSDGKCRADCTAGGDECGPDSLCIDHGRCSEKCAGVSVNLERVNPTVMLLIDQSGSMNEDFGGMTRWEAVQKALVDPSDGVVFSLEDEILFGAALYTSHGGFSGGECPILTTVAPSLNNASAIASLIGSNGPDGDTPTGESIGAVVDYLAGLPPDSITPLRIIVLATDGEPDTCEEPNPQNGQEESVAAAQAAFAAGVKTFVLSVGTDVAASHLQDMANAGAGLPVGGPENAPYYVADSPAALRDAFSEIAQGSRSCIFALDGRVEPMSYAEYGKVTLNGRDLAYGDPDGWQLDDPSTLRLLGSACQEYLDSESPTLDASFPCGAFEK
ncbi:MAG: VWA domain-containing protein [Deltaproteobacteria bacterium]|nr:MAG: VWA domain-containing protein [Deltaproteobacteria bacterium]